MNSGKQASLIAFKKPTEIVHTIQVNSITLTQLKMKNKLLEHACTNGIPPDGWLRISQYEMLHGIENKTRNSKHLRESLLGLMSIIFQYDVLGKNRTLWAAAVLFPNIYVDDKIICYKINDQLHNIILNPETYIRLRLEIINKFSRHAAIKLYEMCLRFVRTGTGPISLAAVKQIALGSEKADKGIYKEFKNFNYYILKPAIQEINQLTDIIVDVVPIYDGKIVIAIKFLVKRKIEVIGQTELSSSTVIGLRKIGLPESQIISYGKTHSEEDILIALEYVKQRMGHKREKLENPAAYFVSTLTQGWATTGTGVNADGMNTTLDLFQDGNGFLSVKDGNQTEKIKSIQPDSKYLEAKKIFEYADQELKCYLIREYNEQQSVKKLRYAVDNQSKLAEAAFLNWLKRQNLQSFAVEQAQNTGILEKT